LHLDLQGSSSSAIKTLDIPCPMSLLRITNISYQGSSLRSFLFFHPSRLSMCAEACTFRQFFPIFPFSIPLYLFSIILCVALDFGHSLRCPGQSRWHVFCQCGHTEPPTILLNLYHSWSWWFYIMPCSFERPFVLIERTQTWSRFKSLKAAPFLWLRLWFSFPSMSRKFPFIGLCLSRSRFGRNLSLDQTGFGILIAIVALWSFVCIFQSYYRKSKCKIYSFQHFLRFHIIQYRNLRDWTDS
jgi:hypothetical protein